MRIGIGTDHALEKVGQRHPRGPVSIPSCTAAGTAACCRTGTRTPRSTSRSLSGRSCHSRACRLRAPSGCRNRGRGTRPRRRSAPPVGRLRRSPPARTPALTTARQGRFRTWGSSRADRPRGRGRSYHRLAHHGPETEWVPRPPTPARSPRVALKIKPKSFVASLSNNSCIYITIILAVQEIFLF